MLLPPLVGRESTDHAYCHIGPGHSVRQKVFCWEAGSVMGLRSLSIGLIVMGGLRGTSNVISTTADGGLFENDWGSWTMIALDSIPKHRLGLLRIFRKGYTRVVLKNDVCIVDRVRETKLFSFSVLHLLASKNCLSSIPNKLRSHRSRVPFSLLAIPVT